MYLYSATYKVAKIYLIKLIYCERKFQCDYNSSSGGVLGLQQGDEHSESDALSQQAC